MPTDKPQETINLEAQLAELKEENLLLKSELELSRLKEEKFHAAFEFNPVTVSIIRISDFTIIDLNEGFLIESGLIRENVVGHTAKELNIWVDETERQLFYQQVQTEGEVRDQLCQLRGAMGTKYALLSAKIIQLYGEPHLLFVAKNVQELVESNEALELQKRRIRALLDAPSNHTLLIDRQGMILASNQAAAAFYQYSIEQFIGRSLWSELPEQQQETLKSVLVQAAEDKAPQQTFAQFDHRWVMINLYPILDQTEGVSEFALVLRDITDLKQAELDSNAQEQKYRMLFEAIDEGFALFECHLHSDQTVDLTCFEINQALHEILELKSSVDHFEVENFSKYFDPQWKRELEQVVRSGESKRFETYLSAQDRYLEVYAFIPPIGQLACRFIDITERKRTLTELQASKVAAEAATQAKSRFLATMSHEIRTPLNGVLGMTSLLEQSKLTEEQSEFVSIIGQCGENLLEVINDILDFTKLESKKVQFEHIPFDLHDLIEETFSLCAPHAASKRLELLYTIHPKIPKVLLGDPGRIRQLLLNLVGNGIKFSDKGEIMVTVHKDNSRTEGSWLKFFVKDQGIGISPEQQKLLFQPFEQIDGSTTRKYGGSGLGLAISQRMVEQAGGDLTVESELGRGATFSFSLNLPPGMQALASQVLRPPQEVRQQQVLLFDDNPIHKASLISRFHAIGIQAIGHRISKQAIHWIDEAPAHTLVMVNLPDRSNGFSYEQTIALCNQAVKKGFPVVKLIFLTDNRTELPCPECLTANKPIRMTSLVQVMSKAVSLTQASQANPTRKFDHHLAQKFPMKILVAEDNDLNQTLILKLLEKLGYQADLAVDGIEALKKIQATNYDLLLLDIQMPNMDGLEVTKTLQEIKGDVKQPIIIAMTANAMRGDKERYLRSGMNDYLAKPIDPFRLQYLLETYGETISTS